MDPLLKLFAKQPVEGKAKTRLAAHIGAAAAARVAAGLILETVALATRAWPGEVRMLVWPDADHAVFEHIARTYGIGFEQQVPGDLGTKMMAALDDGLNEGVSTAVMGCDMPHCPPKSLEDVAQQIRLGRDVIGRAEDGGFWVLGLTQPVPGLFDGIDWDVAGTGERTVARARSAGVVLYDQIPMLFDIDTVEDLERLHREYPAMGARIAHADIDAK